MIEKMKRKYNGEEKEYQLSAYYERGKTERVRKKSHNKPTQARDSCFVW